MAHIMFFLWAGESRHLANWSTSRAPFGLFETAALIKYYINTLDILTNEYPQKDGLEKVTFILILHIAILCIFPRFF